MLAALQAKIEGMKAQRMVLDALDVILALLPSAAGIEVADSCGLLCRAPNSPEAQLITDR